jgi:protein involved in polysaccharide export with SLBB domain
VSKSFSQLIRCALIGFALWLPISGQGTSGVQSPIDCQKVTLVGAVRAADKPVYSEQNIRLNELIDKAGGPTESADRVQVIYGKSSRANHPGIDPAYPPVQMFMLSEVLKGNESSNPELQPGDIVVILARPVIYVLGSVVRPQGIELQKELTISQAITQAGGLTRSGRKDRIRILRQTPGSFARVQIDVDLKAIEKHRVADLVLQPYDLIEAWEKNRIRDRAGPVPIGGEPCYPCCEKPPMRVIM